MRGIYAKSKAGRCRTASEVARANWGLDGPWAAELVRSCLIWALFDSKLSLREKKGPARAGPTLNPRQGGDGSHQRQPRLIGAGRPLGRRS